MTDQAAPPTTTPTWLQFIKTVIEFVQIIIWPCLVVAFVVVFRGPIDEIATALPRKVEAATKVGVGTLTLEIQEQAKSTGNVELAKRLGRLSPEAIKRLIELGPSWMRVIGSSREPIGERYYFSALRQLRVISELKDNNLLEFGEDWDEFMAWIYSGRFRVEGDLLVPNQPLSEKDISRLQEQYYKLNKLGLEAWQAVLDAILKQLRAPATAADADVQPPASESGANTGKHITK
jgi:hypothetical protein